MNKATSNMSCPELMTHFDKFVLKTVGMLLVIGIVGIAGTMINMNITIAKMEANLMYLSEKIEDANKDRYTLNMAAVDKALFNSRIDSQVKRSDEAERKISLLFNKIVTIEKDIIKISR